MLDRMVGLVGIRDLGRISGALLPDRIGSILDTRGNDTIGKVHSAAPKRIFGFAKGRKMIGPDPTQDLSVGSGKRYEAKMRGYRDDEAALILAARREPSSDRMSDEHRAARRWVPWLCAYTGARVNEMTRLRRCDVVVVGGLAHLCVAPEAGTVRTAAREVPLHPDLLDQGFMAFVSTKSGKEPLFHAAPRSGADVYEGVLPHEEVGARLAKWVRKLGITDRQIHPSHAWRHWFRTSAIEVGIGERVVDALQGRAQTDVARRRGGVTLQDKEAAIRLMPRFDPARVLAEQNRSGA